MTHSFRAPPFTVEATRTGSTAIVAVVGELDIATSPQLRAALDGLEPGYEKLVIDLSGCSFFASSGISILLDEHARGAEQGFEVIVIKAAPEVQRMFDLAGLDDKLTFQDPQA